MYLTNEWLTIRQTNGKNVSRWDVKTKWIIIQNAGLNYQVSPLTREVIKTGDINRLLDQGVGILLSVAALANHESLSDTLMTLKTWAKLKLEKRQISFEGEKIKRRKRFII